MRIISGKYKGKQIHPGTKFKARPTTDFAKESLFNILIHQYDIEGLLVLDLFSGTGSISYEFASRGAKQVVSVELNGRYHSFIRKMSEQMNLPVKAVKANAFQFIKSCVTEFDILFADPPYSLKGIDKLPELIFAGKLLKNDGILIIEHSASTDYTKHLYFRDKRTYGQVNFSFFYRDIESNQ